MKVYNRNPLGIEIPPLDSWVIPAIILLIIVGLFFYSQGGLSPNLRAELLQNPLHLSTNDSTLMHVYITNPYSETASTIKVNVTAPGSAQLSIYPRTQTIATLGPGEQRTLEFLIAPIDMESNPFLPGTYKLNVSAKVKDTTLSTSVLVHVEK